MDVSLETAIIICLSAILLVSIIAIIMLLILNGELKQTIEIQENLLKK